MRTAHGRAHRARAETQQGDAQHETREAPARGGGSSGGLAGLLGGLFQGSSGASKALPLLLPLREVDAACKACLNTRVQAACDERQSLHGGLTYTYIYLDYMTTCTTV